MELAQHIKRIEEVLTFHLLFPTAGPVNKDRAALASLRAIAEHIGVEMEPLPDEVSNAERMREAARTYNERKRR